MARVRYATSGPWFKGNTHVHTTASDGGLDCGEVARRYAGAGYDFIFVTDHGVVADVERTELPLLALNGVEIDGTDRWGGFYHVVGLGISRPIERGATFTKALKVLRESGALTILAHPHWTGNSIREALRHGFDGVEVYNHVCNWLNGKSGGSFHWDCMLEAQGDVLGFAADDAHIKPAHPGWDGGWIMVNAPRLARADILRAIRRGRFYSTTGPLIRSIRAGRRRVELRCTPAKEIRLAGPRSFGRRVGAGGRKPLTRAEFELADPPGYLRLEVEDFAGRRAWTNCLHHRHPRRA